ncbi:MAG: hypothetical protein ABR867_05115 [Nitrososphaerales archaeon]
MRFAALGLVVAMEIGAFVFIYPMVAGPQGPGITFTFPTTHPKTSTTKTTHLTNQTANKVVVKSATISDGSLKLDIKNTGTVWTKNLTVSAICSSDLLDCYSYKALAGHVLTRTFALAPKSEYVYVIAGVCVVPLPSCAMYHPVTNFSYYYAVTVGFETGPSAIFPVTATATNTSPHNLSFQGITYTLKASPKVGQGELNLNILLNPVVHVASFVVSMNAHLGKGAFTWRLLTLKTGCGSTNQVACSAGNLILDRPFSTVATGIGTPIHPPPYLLIVQDMQAKLKSTVYFAVWVPSVTTSTSTSTSTSASR